MFKNLFSNRLFIGAFAFFIFCVGGSLLYQQHVERQSAREFAETQERIKGLTEKPKPKPTAEVRVGDTSQGGRWQGDVWQSEPHTGAADVFPKRDEPNGNLAAANLSDLGEDETVSAEVPAEDVPVSPYGFGPYPEVPEAFIQKVGRPPWLVDRRSELPENTKRGIEIISRVLIGLWKQGDESIINGFRDGSTGRVYPFYENTIYVRRHRSSKESQSKGIEIYSDPSVMLTAEERHILHDGGEAPAGIRVLDLDSAGVDPSQFLNMR